MIKEEYFKLQQITSRFGDIESIGVETYSRSKETLEKYLDITIKKEIKERITAGEKDAPIIVVDKVGEFVYTDHMDKWRYEYTICQEKLKFIDDSDLESQEALDRITAWD
jgi:hypothetical protein